ncbi:MAG: UDP-3-O-(3-hydroxymyristoyl)glucosamine N-acyltransferase [Planctomycetia bacterium]|nr:UDP-3-O-(3-hydroxymyristoyl)glucosamine N-acyltransferase [Planctomycetia bacterium]
MTSLTTTEIAQRLGGRLTGNGQLIISDTSPLHAATGSSLSFLCPGTLPAQLEASNCGAALVPCGFQTEHCPVIEVENVTAAFEEIVRYFRPVRTELVRGVSPKADIDPSVCLPDDIAIGAFATIGRDVVLGAGVVIHAGVRILDGVTIGEGTILFPNVVIYENCVLGKNCLVQAGAVIGGYGFGYDSSSGQHKLGPQLGNVVLGDDVEIGAATTIDRGTYGSTRIGDGTKIDNQVMIGHNCVIGRNNLICASVGIAGSTTTGDYAVMAGRVGIADHIKVGNGAVIGAMAGIMADVPPGARVVGIPATPEKEQMKKQVALAKLPEMRREFKAVQERLAKLEEKCKD